MYLKKKKIQPFYKSVISVHLFCPVCIYIDLCVVNCKFADSWFIFNHLTVLNPYFSSVQFSRSVMSDSLWPHKLQHANISCPSSAPGAYSRSCPLSQWCHPTLSSSVTPLSSCPQSFPESGSFRMSWLLASGGQSIGASTSASVLLMNIQDWFPLGMTGLISLLSKGFSVPPDDRR